MRPDAGADGRGQQGRWGMPSTAKPLLHLFKLLRRDAHCRMLTPKGLDENRNLRATIQYNHEWTRINTNENITDRDGSNQEKGHCNRSEQREQRTRESPREILRTGNRAPQCSIFLLREGLCKPHKLLEAYRLSPGLRRELQLLKGALEFFCRPIGFQQLEHHLAPLRKAALHDSRKNGPLCRGQKRLLPANQADTGRIGVRLGKETTRGNLKELLG